MYNETGWITNILYTACHLLTTCANKSSSQRLPSYDPRILPVSEPSVSVGFVRVTVLEKSSLQKKDLLWPMVLEVPVTWAGGRPLVFGWMSVSYGVCGWAQLPISWWLGDKEERDMSASLSKACVYRPDALPPGPPPDLPPASGAISWGQMSSIGACRVSLLARGLTWPCVHGNK